MPKVFLNHFFYSFAFQPNRLVFNENDKPVPAEGTEGEGATQETNTQANNEATEAANRATEKAKEEEGALAEGVEASREQANAMAESLSQCFYAAMEKGTDLNGLKGKCADLTSKYEKNTYDEVMKYMLVLLEDFVDFNGTKDPQLGAWALQLWENQCGQNVKVDKKCGPQTLKGLVGAIDFLLGNKRESEERFKESELAGINEALLMHGYDPSEYDAEYILANKGDGSRTPYSVVEKYLKNESDPSQDELEFLSAKLGRLREKLDAARLKLDEAEDGNDPEAINAAKESFIQVSRFYANALNEYEALKWTKENKELAEQEFKEAEAARDEAEEKLKKNEMTQEEFDIIQADYSEKFDMMARAYPDEYESDEEPQEVSNELVEDNETSHNFTPEHSELIKNHLQEHYEYTMTEGELNEIWELKRELENLIGKGLTDKDMDYLASEYYLKSHLESAPGYLDTVEIENGTFTPETWNKIESHSVDGATNAEKVRMLEIAERYKSIWDKYPTVRSLIDRNRFGNSQGMLPIDLQKTNEIVAQWESENS